MLSVSQRSFHPIRQCTLPHCHAGLQQSAMTYIQMHRQLLHIPRAFFQKVCKRLYHTYIRTIFSDHPFSGPGQTTLPDKRLHWYQDSLIYIKVDHVILLTQPLVMNFFFILKIKHKISDQNISISISYQSLTMDFDKDADDQLEFTTSKNVAVYVLIMNIMNIIILSDFH